MQRPDSIDPHLLAFAFRSALWNTNLSAAKEILWTRETRMGKTRNILNSTDLLARVFEGCPMSHVRTRALGGENSHSFKSFSCESLRKDIRAKSRERKKQILYKPFFFVLFVSICIYVRSHLKIDSLTIILLILSNSECFILITYVCDDIKKDQFSIN